MTSANDHEQTVRCVPVNGFSDADDPFGRRPAPRRSLTGVMRMLRRVLGAVGRWRNWRLPVKLTAVTLVPVVFAITVSAMEIDGHAQRAQRYAAVAERVSVGQTIREVVAAAQRERNFAAVAAAPDGPGRDRKARAEHPLDAAVTAARAAMRKLPGDDPVVAARWADVRRQLGRIPGLRKQWRANVDATITGYSDLIDSLLALDRALAASGGDADIVRSASALYALDGATEALFREQALVLAGITRGHMLRGEAAGLREAEARRSAKVAGFRSLADAAQQRAYDSAMSGPAVARRTSYLHTAVRNASAQRPAGRAGNRQDATPTLASWDDGVEPLRLSASDWNSSSDATTGKLRGVTAGMAAALRSRAGSLHDAATDGAITVAIVLLLALLLATACVWVIARQLAQSIRTLHRSAREVAEHSIPAVVADIQGGNEVRKTIDPVPVSGDDEVGQLARAFDAVHAAARELAVEQAGLRSSYGAVFVNLSRRSQGLVQRQLRLLERLERDEEDPEQLSTLFQLDHLATRMRRNNENLMVLSGNGQAKSRPQPPTPVGDLLRAAVSEIEQYHRVTLHVPPAVHVVGYAAGDVVRLLAELLDNATSFSSPDTQVTVSTHQRAEGAVVVDVVDEGIGMREEELAHANQDLAGTSATELPATRRMGLFVVARLAESHGIEVRLHGGEGIGGLRASVTMPATLVVGTAGRQRSAPPSAPPESDLETTLAASTLAALPALPGWTGTALYEPVPETGPMITRAEATASPEARENGAPAGISAAALFAAARQAPTPRPTPKPPARPGPEKTPIFDEMISAWFDPDAEGPEPLGTDSGDASGREDGDEGGSRWQSEADSGWRAAHRATREHAAGSTAAGLPQRTPRAQLVPGSAGASGAAGGADRDARRVHERLSSFQNGVASGRHDSGAASAGGRPSGTPGSETAEPERDGVPEPAEAAGASETAAGEPPAGAHSSGLPQRRPSSARAEHAEGVPAPPEDTAGGDAWHFGSDDGWEAVARVAEAVESAAGAGEQTTAGLPQRRPREHLLPGSVGGGHGGGSEPPGRDAAGVRDRLASFQRGVQEGRGGAAAVVDAGAAAVAEDTSEAEAP